MRFLFFFLLSIYCFSQNLNQLRSNIASAKDDKKTCEQMINSINTNSKNAVEIAYLGAYQTIWANHSKNPIQKLNTFNKGKKNIESAVKNAQNNIEVRLIRLMIQSNSPNFLGYNKEIIEDRRFIESNKKNVKDSDLKNLINKVL